MRVAPAIEFDPEDEAESLGLVVPSRVSSVRGAERARSVLRATQRMPSLQIGQQSRIARITAGRRRQRYFESG